MDKLRIHVDDHCGKTVSKFAVGHKDEIEFINKHPSKTLTVSIQTDPKDGNALCCDGEGVETFALAPHGGKRAFKICETYEPPKAFKYTATLEGSEPEDPIIIIERS